MAQNKLSDLRDHLFETLERLKDKDEPMEIERAKAVCEVGQVLINSAKVELEYLEMMGQTDSPSEFLKSPAKLPPAAPKNVRMIESKAK